MAKGNLASIDLPAGVNTVVYPVPAGQAAMVNVNFCNRTTTPIKIRWAVAATSSPALANWRNYDVEIPANGVLERTGVTLSTSNNSILVAYASAVGISVNVDGIEEAA